MNATILAMGAETGFKGDDASAPGELRPIGIGGTAFLFGTGALLLWAATRLGMPLLAQVLCLESILLWFLAGGLGVFVPLIAIGLIVLSREGSLGQPNLWRERLRFRPMNAGDWLASVLGLSVIGLVTGGTLVILRTFFPEVSTHPTFVTLTPLGPGRYWILAFWLPFFLVNILGEEFLWRGVLLPRQELAFGRWAWLANGIGWLAFHIPFGWQILLPLWPTVFVINWLAHRRKNSWIGAIIHGGLNGPAFLAISLGLI
jgi:membrane protease YdiL (CAAX protease family)